ncbi:MAG: glycosyltransferase [archaeon]|nr:glycosyltransferase [archaeon]
MKIAIFTDSYVPQINGVVTQIRNVSRELKRHGHEILIVAPSESLLFLEKEVDGIRVLYVRSIPLPSYDDYKITAPTSKRVLRELKKFSPDLVHVHTPFGVGWLGVRYAKRLKVPLIGTYHTLIPEFMMYLPIPFLKHTKFAKKAAWRYTNHFYGKCDLITTPSESMRRELEKNGSKKVEVVPNAIDFEMFNSHAKKNYAKNAHKIIYFGRVGFEKNIEVLFFALKHLLWKDKKAHLTITGSGPALKFLKDLAKEEKLESHVSFSGALRESELAKHVAQHDVFLTASTIETQGLTILEAMAAGVPVIGADFLAIPDSVKDGKNGFLFKAFDFVECAKKSEKLLSSQLLRKKLGKGAIETARKYSIEKIASQWEQLYAKIAS